MIVANQKHVEHLKQGPGEWNKYREKNIYISQRPDFIKAHLKGANLKGANLSEAYLEKANLREAYLEKANLTEANLKKANLREANLSEAHLEKANLKGANLKKANLREANLSEAHLEKANLKGATNLTIDQLSIVKTLYNVVGLDSTLEEQLREKYPELFVKP